MYPVTWETIPYLVDTICFIEVVAPGLVLEGFMMDLAKSLTLVLHGFLWDFPNMQTTQGVTSLPY